MSKIQTHFYALDPVKWILYNWASEFLTIGRPDFRRHLKSKLDNKVSEIWTSWVFQTVTVYKLSAKISKIGVTK